MSRTPYSRNSYTGGGYAAITTSPIDDGTDTITLNFTQGINSWAGLGILGGFFITIDYENDYEERIWVPAGNYDWTQPVVTLTEIVRGQDNTTAQSHGGGAKVIPAMTAVDLEEANYAVAETVGKIGATGDIIYGSSANAFTTLPIGTQGKYLLSDGTRPVWGTGPSGPQGFQGSQGFQGTQGYQGRQGVTGAQGFQGYKGSTGVQGAQGYQGIRGASGYQGNQGDTGPQGAQGIQGAVGQQGPQGVRGLTGDLYQTFSGTEATIGTGEFTFWVNENLNYTVAQNVIIAHDVNNYMTGLVESYNKHSGKLVVNVTEAVGSGEYDEWQINLDGAAAGAQGYQGADGATGAQGFQGNDGATGAQGYQGDIGATGPSGIYISDDGIPPADTNITWLDETATGAEFQGPQGPQGAGFFGDSRLWLFGQDPVDIFMPNGTWLIIGQDTPHWRLGNSDGAAGSDISLNADGKTINIHTTGTYMLRLAFQYTPYQGSNQVRFASGASAYGGNFSGWIAGNPDPLTIAVAGLPGPIQNGDYIGNYIWRIAAGGSFTIAIGTWGNSAPEQLDGIELDIVRVA
jgi:hypothetical protein